MTRFTSSLIPAADHLVLSSFQTEIVVSGSAGRDCSTRCSPDENHLFSGRLRRGVNVHPFQPV